MSRSLCAQVGRQRHQCPSLYSSVVERQSCKLKVLGSIPSGGLFYVMALVASHGSCRSRHAAYRCGLVLHGVGVLSTQIVAVVVYIHTLAGALFTTGSLNYVHYLRQVFLTDCKI